MQKWEHEFHLDIENSKVLHEFISSNGNLKTPILPCNALQGGRVNAIKLFYEATEQESIAYLDVKRKNKIIINNKNCIFIFFQVTSLYPYVNMYCNFPVGPPEIIKSNFDDISTYFGICKLNILPPSKLFLGVLGMKTSDG